MTEPNSPPAPTPAPAPKPRKSPSDVNQADLADIKKFRGAAQTAQSAQYVSTLTDKEITQADVATLIADCDNAETKLAPAVVTATHDKEVATAHEGDAKGELMAVLREMQGAVKRKFETADPSKLSTYFIGKKNFGADRQGLETDAGAMLKQAAADALPGFNAARLTAVDKLLKAWVAADDVQQDAIKKLGQARTDFENMVASIKTRGRNIQLAANDAWSHRDAANAATRRAFGLPVNQPLN